MQILHFNWLRYWRAFRKRILPVFLSINSHLKKHCCHTIVVDPRGFQQCKALPGEHFPFQYVYKLVFSNLLLRFRDELALL